MTVREAEQVVFDHADIPLRSADSRDVRGCYDTCSDFEEMGFVPHDPGSFLNALKSRHKILLRARPEIHPGAFRFPDDGIATFNAARRQHRFMEE